MKCISKKQSLAVTYNQRRIINLSPFYQVDSCRWVLSQKQLYIDSLINGYDTPKIYLHDSSFASLDTEGYSYSLVDGKQRLKESLFAFMDDAFALSVNFKYGKDSVGYELLSEEDYPLAGMKYSDMSNNFKDHFKNITLDIVEIQTSEVHKILDMFRRLQGGTTLNRMEIRNSFDSQTYLDLARKLTQHVLFKDSVKFSSKRMKHLEVACKILMVNHVEATYNIDVCELGSNELDKLVNDNKNIDTLSLKKIESKVEKDVNNYYKVCSSVNLNLKAPTIIPYFVFIKRILNRYTSRSEHKFLIIGMFLESFENVLTEYRHAESPEHLVDLDKYVMASVQHTSDVTSITARVQVLYDRFISQCGAAMLKLDETRNFTPEIREYVWKKAGKKCQICDKSITLSEMDADHKEPWAKGGETTLDNARCLCVSCNRSRKAA